MLGPGGIVREGVERLLAGHGLNLVDAAAADVAVLVEPQRRDWQIAQDAALPIVLVGAATADTVFFLRSVMTGADAVVDLAMSPVKLLHAVAVVRRGHSVLDPPQARAVLDTLRAAFDHWSGVSLTCREREILDAIAAGESLKATARRLGVAVKTIENLQTGLFRKLGARNRAQAVTHAHAAGLIELAATP